jgi:predicted nuclease of predicted toxin-antitoxin system
MNLLADENVDAAIVDWLRRQGHEVVWAAEDYSSTEDKHLLDLANASSQILLTRDLDFGELVFRERRTTFGIIQLRLKAKNQWERLSLLQVWWPKIESNAPGRYLTVSNDRLRVRLVSQPK